MQKNFILPSDDYGQRILIRRTFLGKEASPEALILLSEMLQSLPHRREGSTSPLWLPGKSLSG